MVSAITTCEYRSGNPDEAQRLRINSRGGTFDQREIIDSGFLDWSGGIKNADDPLMRFPQPVDNLSR